MRTWYTYALYEKLPGQRRKFVYIGYGHENPETGYSRIKTYRLLHRVKNGDLGRRAKELAILGGVFEPQILSRFEKIDDAKKAEDRIIQKCILKMIPVLNIQTGGGSGRTFMPSVIKKLKLIHTGVPLPESAKKKLSEYLTGKPKSAEHAKNIALAKLGKPRNEATKEKIRISLLGKKYTRRKTVLTEDEWGWLFELRGVLSSSPYDFTGLVLSQEERYALQRRRFKQKKLVVQQN